MDKDKEAFDKIKEGIDSLSVKIRSMEEVGTTVTLHIRGMDEMSTK